MKYPPVHENGLDSPSVMHLLSLSAPFFSLTAMYISKDNTCIITPHCMQFHFLDPKEYIISTFILIYSSLSIYGSLLYTLYPLYPCLLPTSVTHTLYVAVVTDAPHLLCHWKCSSLWIGLDLSRTCILDTFYFCLQYIRTSPNPNPSLSHINVALSQWTFNTLYLHGFHCYLKCLNLENVEWIFLPIYQWMSSAD